MNRDKHPGSATSKLNRINAIVNRSNCGWIVVLQLKTKKASDRQVTKSLWWRADSSLLSETKNLGLDQWKLGSGSGAFLDPGWVKNQKADPGWTSQTVFRKLGNIFLGFMRIRIRDPKSFNPLIRGSGMNISDPQHWKNPGGLGTPWRFFYCWAEKRLGYMKVTKCHKKTMRGYTLTGLEASVSALRLMEMVEMGLAAMPLPVLAAPATRTNLIDPWITGGGIYEVAREKSARCKLCTSSAHLSRQPDTACYYIFARKPSFFSAKPGACGLWKPIRQTQSLVFYQFFRGAFGCEYT